MAFYLNATNGMNQNLTLNGSRLVVQGDSLTESFDSKTSLSFRSSWVMAAVGTAKGNLKLVHNAGRGGYSSAQLQALFDDEVLAHNPTLVGLMPGRNDGQADGTPATMIKYVTDAVEKCRSRGIGVFLVNTVPQGQASISAPSTITATESGLSNGTVPAGVHRYKVTAGNGPSTGATGETRPSIATATVTTTSGTSQIRITWSHVPGANWYKVYKETSDGSGVYGLIHTTSNGSSPGFFTSRRFIQTAAITPGVTAPTSNTTAFATSQEANRARINAWLSRFAAAESIPLADIYSELVDPATGMWKPGYTYDGTHPTGEANAVIGKKVWSVLGPLVKPAQPPVAKTNTDPLNLISNGLFITSTITGSNTVPTGWARALFPNTGESLTTVVEARAGFLGNALRVENTFPTLATVTSPNYSSGFSVGDKLLFTFMAEMNTAAGNDSFQVVLQSDNSQILAGFNFVGVDVEPTLYNIEVTVPTGATSLKIIETLSGQGPARTGQFTLYNLTTQNYL